MDKKMNGRPSLIELLHSCKIASPCKGNIDVKAENLRKLLDAVDTTEFGSRNPPVAILAVTGPKKSGKTFLTNFIIQYLSAECGVWWMSKITKKASNGKPMESGFSWANVSNEAFYKPEGGFAAAGGVYLWPQPFLLRKIADDGNDLKLMVWITNIESGEDWEERDTTLLGKFLTLACSRILEIKWDNDELQILEAHQNASSEFKPTSSTSVCTEELCNSVVFVARSENKTTAGTDDEAKKGILELVKDVGKRAAYEKILDKFQNVNFICMKESSEPLHDTNGLLNPKAMKTMGKVIKSVVEKMIDESEIFQKRIQGVDEDLTLENMHYFFERIAKTLSCGQPHLDESPEERPRIMNRESRNVEDLSPGLQRIKREQKLEERKQQQEADKRRQEDEQRQRKEEKRKRDEEEKLLMDECFQVVVSQMAQVFPASIRIWINEHLTLSEVNQMEVIYTHTLSGTVEEHRPVVPSKLWDQFVRKVDKHCKAECIQTLKIISQPVVSINKSIKKKFELHGYLTTSKLQQIADDELQKITKSICEGFELEMVKLAAEKLLKIYNKHSLLIVEAEKINYEIVMGEMMSVYNEHMKRYLQDAPYSTKAFQEIHSKLTEKLVDDLGKNLTEAFATHRQSHERQLEKLQVGIKKIIQNSKTRYHEKVDEVIFSNNPDGLDEKTLKTLHDKIIVDTEKLLGIDIRAKVRDNEPLENYLNVMRNHMEEYWRTVVYVNSKNIEKRKEREEKERRQQKKLEARRELEERERAAARKSSGPVCETNTTATRKQPETYKKTITNESSLPPLVFHLLSSSIVMGMEINGRPQILKNEAGENQTPACVAITNEQGFIYGLEALSFAQSHSISSSITNIGFWSLVDFFEDYNWKRTKIVENKEYDFTGEFMLGFLLRKLKDMVENNVGGRCMVTTIAVPFWLSSLQRIQVKHGAKIAGFADVYLVNEASAAAYYVVNNEGRNYSAANFLVVSENYDRVNAFVYSYSGYEKKLRMLGHASNYHEEDYQRKPGVYKSIQNECINGLNFMWGVLTGENTLVGDENETNSIIRSACKTAIDRAKMAFNFRDNPNECFFICENSTKWSDTLEKVTRDFGKKVCDIKEENVVISGSIALSKCPKEIGSNVRDMIAHNVLRFTIGGGVSVICRNDSLPIQPKKHLACLTHGYSQGIFYQDVMGKTHTVADIWIKGGIRYSQTFTVKLQVTHEAIVKFDSAWLKSSNYPYPCLVDAAQVICTTQNLPEDQVEKFVTLLDKGIEPLPPKESSELVQAKKGLLQKCKEMTEKIANEEFKIKSPLAKDLVLKKISEATEFAEHTYVSLEIIQKKMKLMEELCKKYEK